MDLKQIRRSDQMMSIHEQNFSPFVKRDCQLTMRKRDETKLFRLSSNMQTRKRKQEKGF